LSSRSFGKSLCILVAGAALLQPSAQAKTGADLLLKSFKGKAPAKQKSAPQAEAETAQDLGIESVAQFKLNDPISVQFFSVWNDQRSELSPELNYWSRTFLKGDWEQTLHLWDSVEGRLSSAFRPAANAARLASLARLGLAQTVTEEWIDLLGSGVGTSGEKWIAMLESTLPHWMMTAGGDDPSATWDKVLMERGIILTPERQNEVMRLNATKRPSLMSLQAFAALRRGDYGQKVLTMLKDDNRLKLPLAQTVALALARKGDLASAASILKEHAEPAIEAQKDFGRVSGYLLQIARFLFQAGMWEEAESYLRKIPTSSPEFLNSREELAWILLRKGDVANLRGEVASLSALGLDTQFRPELAVVRAISNLKLCSYGAVQKDFSDFQTSNGVWAQKIDRALKAPETPAPVELDSYSRLAQLRVQGLDGEVAKLSDLHLRSLKTGTPSVVGRQSQWKRLELMMKSRLETAKKIMASEFNRQWRNQKALLSEAIRKMRFVKVELLHQMRQAIADQNKGMDVVATTQAAPIQTSEGSSEALVFPLDGVLWPDELFKIQSQVENRCLRALQGAR